MRVTLPSPHRLSLEPSAEWSVDEMEPKAVARFGVYLRAIAQGVFINVRAQEIDAHALDEDGLRELLGQQNWASAPFDIWVTKSPELIIVGGTFETVGMHGEVVLEAFATDGTHLANLAVPGERALIVAVTPAIQRLARTIEFSNAL